MFWEAGCFVMVSMDVRTSNHHYLLPPSFPLYLTAFANASIAGETPNKRCRKPTVGYKQWLKTSS